MIQPLEQQLLDIKEEFSQLRTSTINQELRSISGNNHQRTLLAQGYCALNENQMHQAGISGGLQYVMSPISHELIIKAILVDPYYLGNYCIMM